MSLSNAPKMVIKNARIFHPGQNPSQESFSILIADQRIIAIEPSTKTVDLDTDATIIDAQNRWLLPAFTDSHTHFSSLVSRQLQVDLSDCNSLEEALYLIRKKAETTPSPGWITGGGWDKNRWGMEDFPDKKMLDDISNHHFIALQSKDWHSLWVNSHVLLLNNITEFSPDPEGGRILRVGDGQEPSGILQEKACAPVLQGITPFMLSELRPFFSKIYSDFHRLGFTAIHSVETPYDFSHYQSLYAQQELGLRTYWYFPASYLNDSDSTYQGFSGNSDLKICGVKAFADGSLGSQTAAMISPYEKTANKGVATLSPNEIQQIVRESTARKLSCAIHAIGDHANRVVLDAFEANIEASRAAGVRHRIEHVQLLHPNDLNRLSDLDVIASVQPRHLAADVEMIETHWGDRGRLAYAFESLRHSGAKLIFGSDTPIESYDPWRSIYAAVTRRPHCDPQQPPFYPEEQLSLSAALTAYTLAPSFAVFEEKKLGSITPGKLADMIMIDTDIFALPPEALLETNVLLTLRDGKILYDNR